MTTEKGDMNRTADKKICTACGAAIDAEAIMCPVCGVAQERKTAAAEKNPNVFGKIINNFKAYKARWFICCGVLLAVIAIILTVSIVSYRASFEYIVDTVKDEYPRADIIYFGAEATIDTNTYDKYAYEMSKTELAVASFTESASRDAIKLMNEKLGFDSALFEKMKKTTETMGERTEENDKYKVRWSASVKKGLEVKYSEK